MKKYDGTVRSVLDFGAFVDIGAESEGLLHISRISGERVENIYDVLSEGQKVEVWVSGKREDEEKFGLTMVEGKMDRAPADLTPFADLPSDEWYNGKVARTAPFGAFVTVTLDSGAQADGLVHVSKIKDTCLMRGKVARLAPFGAFVTVTTPDGDATADGLVHITQIRDGFVESVEDELQVGQEVEVRVESANNEDGKMSDELVDLQVAGLHEGEITLLLAAEEEEEKELEDIADAQAKGGKGAIKGTKGTKGYGQDERVGFMYTKQQLLECRAAVLRDGKTVQLASLSQCPEEELETTLVRALLAGDLPPAWWSKRTMPLKRQALRVALRVANMQAVYAMQPESLQFREALSCIVEQLVPEQTLVLLSRYFNDMSKIIEHHDGVVIEFIGDAILAVFGAPAKIKEHALACVRAMMKMQRGVQRINQWSKKKGLPHVSIRCGIHSGWVGNLGFHSRLKFGVIGEHSTLPAKLEELNKTYGTSNLISEATYRRLQDEFVVRPIDYAEMYGEGEDLEEQVYEVVCFLNGRQSFKNNLRESLAKKYEQALRYYVDRKFDKAAAIWREVSLQTGQYFGLFDKASVVMRKRACYYQRHPPAPNWRGIWTLSREPTAEEPSAESA
eukprot:g8738.t1